MKKKFLIGLIALLGVSLCFFGCSDSDDGGSSPPTPEQLATALKAEFDGVTGITAEVDGRDVTLTLAAAKAVDFDVNVPADVTLKVSGDVLSLAAGKGLTVTGTVTVENGAGIKFSATGDDVDFEANGKIEIEKGATLAYGDNVVVADTGAPYKWDPADTGTVGSKITLRDGNVTEVTKGKLQAVSNDTILAGDKIVVAAEGVLTVTSTVTEFNVAGNIEVTGVFVIEDNAAGDLDGTITVKNGGVSKDLKTGGGSLWAAESTGKYVFEAGAKGFVGTATNPLIGPDDTTTPPMVALTSGTFSNEKDAYTVAGNVTIRGSFGFNNTTHATVESGKLTVELSWDDGKDWEGTHGFFIGNGAYIDGAAGAQIEVKAPQTIDPPLTGGNIYINNSATAGENFYDTTGAKLSPTGAVVVGVGVYNWVADADGGGTAGWKQQS
jgi:hypothetical protein